jgi:predicted PurR-regulated permease PerM
MSSIWVGFLINPSFLTQSSSLLQSQPTCWAWMESECVHFYRTCPSISICTHIQHSRWLSDIGSSSSRNVVPNLCTNAYQVVSSFWAETKGIQKLCELQESLFVCLFVSSLVSSPYQKMLGGNRIL